MNQREIFLRHVAQTSPAPLGLEISRASGVRLYGKNGEEYIDLIGGISVANMGHGHPAIIAAIKEQADAYLHIMIYGEFIESPQVQYAQLLCSHLPASLDSVYFTNSGAEAVEGAMKLAKRVSNRTQVIAFNRSYHGSTQGALSIIGDEYWRNAYRPLLPDVMHLEYNSFESLDEITGRTACVFAETVQAEAGVRAPSVEWMKALRKKCDDTGTLLVLDEIQTGFGRTGTLWGFTRFGIVPDILLLGKALGGGLPMGAFITSREMMFTLAENPVLGHITTFGGHPLCCAAGHAAMQAMLSEKIVDGVEAKGALLEGLLNHPMILEKTRCGLWMALRFDSFETNKKVIDRCIEKGVLTDWFLFASDSLRISPPLVIGEDDLQKVAGIILSVLDELTQ
ncbi:MAG: aspartate aminotransferase family protein [Chitinophagaceae bacterium]|nr:MAG: aspartate aminotransferase family protein [Chitinophagaceae bacterium]